MGYEINKGNFYTTIYMIMFGDSKLNLYIYISLHYNLPIPLIL